jgi:pimeloyl-ACP methyl ester carboxylesterase
VVAQPDAEPVDAPADSEPAYGPVGRSPWLDIDWREHQRWLTVDGQAVNAIELGTEETQGGQPIVFVHGLAGSWPNWLEQLPVLAENHRVLALDLPGFGHSPMPSEKISISGYARLLDDILEQLGIDAAVLVGNSMGGFVAAELAIAFPRRVERLVLISAAGLSTHSQPSGRWLLRSTRHLERIIAASAGWVAARSDAVARHPRLREAALNVVVRHPSRLPGALAAEQIRGAGTPGFLPALQAILAYDVRERLPEIACPTLIVWGESDRLITVRDAEVFAQLIPNSRKVLYKDTGHMAMLERPAAFNALLGAFLAE